MNKIIFTVAILLSGFCFAQDKFVITKEYKQDVKDISNTFVVTEVISNIADETPKDKCICEKEEGVTKPCNPVCQCDKRGGCNCTNCTCHLKKEEPKAIIQVQPALQAVRTLAYRTEVRRTGCGTKGGCKFYEVKVPYYTWTYPQVTKQPVKTVQPTKSTYRKTQVQQGMHSHVCGRCGHEFWHFSGSHRCPRCGSGPWTLINRRS